MNGKKDKYKLSQRTASGRGRAAALRDLDSNESSVSFSE